MTKRTAKIAGFARSFVSGEPISEGIVTVLEDDSLRFVTDSDGRFGPFDWPIGEPITLVFEKPGSFWTGFRTTQTATLIVPEEGYNDDNYLKNISFQVPSNMAYEFFAFAMGGVEDPLACQITTTITPANTTMDDIPQGVTEVTGFLSPDVNAQRFYFDIFPICHKTNPFVRDLVATSLDGGMAFVNVPPGDYTITAVKEGMTFSQVKIKARSGVLVNVSPPHGPTLLSANPVGFFSKSLGSVEPLEEGLEALTI